MDRQPPSRPAYELPASSALGAAVDQALNDNQTAHEQLGRVMLVVTAAAVRDILTGHQPGAPFDAARLELVAGEDSLFPTGRYWTTAGAERTFTDDVGQTEAGNALHDLSGWTAYLDDNTRGVWRPLCDELPDRYGRPAFTLDLMRAASLTLDPPSPAAPEAAPGSMVEVLVCANDRDHYPALIDPADQRDGYVRPWLDLRTVRRIAADTQRDAARYGHGSIDTVHVLSGRVNRTRHAVVIVTCWMHLAGERREQAVEVLHPNADGRYAIGGHEWGWYALDRDLFPLIPFRPDGI
ncbi:hypothetical protein [Streptomyces griseofuscus]|uniref:Uncharacterized protein n=1 Tax=Streptomyces griseofuscus TaxID=146922 RepID=A0A7H1Q3N1_9ACTN|nr:hypothetical protein [Streptomyces griseofuscus]QNT94911.1 hypothetical protein HEP81_04638 [Streptomyces griseofuscus]